MAATESSSSSSRSPSSSCASFTSLDGDATVRKSRTTVKFLCSYGGRIIPRHTDGKLRYAGGHTRVLSVHRSIPFSELEEKLREMCGWKSASLRCRLPMEDLDETLVSITSDEDLADVFQLYELSLKGVNLDILHTFFNG